MADFHCRATAHVGLLDYGNPEPGETVLVNGAAGAIGSTAGQIVKIQVRPEVRLARNCRKERIGN